MTDSSSSATATDNQADTQTPAVPRHIAIIMDGNGRWARQQDMHRTYGHAQGAKRARETMIECAKLGVEVLTLYSFSTENWKRPKEEVDFLMQLGQEQMRAERQTLIDHNIRFHHVGSTQGVPASMAEEMAELADATAKNTGLTLALALNYGSRMEITEAVRKLATDAAAGKLDPASITEQSITDALYTSGLPDPDLLIRTAGERRISNFLLWQISYAELYITDLCWPDFSAEQLHLAIDAYSQRQRRFGTV